MPTPTFATMRHSPHMVAQLMVAIATVDASLQGLAFSPWVADRRRVHRSCVEARPAIPAATPTPSKEQTA